MDGRRARGAGERKGPRALVGTLGGAERFRSMVQKEVPEGQPRKPEVGSTPSGGIDGGRGGRGGHRNFLGSEGEVHEEGREARVVFERQKEPRHLDERAHPVVSEARVNAHLKLASTRTFQRRFERLKPEVVP